MTLRFIAAVTALVAVAACGGSTPAGPHGPTAASVAAQPPDLPNGMTKCDLSGDINSVLEKEKTSDPSSYNTTKSDWESAQKRGATAAYSAFYTDSSQHCTAIRNKGSDIGSATYKLVADFVVQFKDEKSAANEYTSDSVLGFSASSLKSSGMPVTEGTKTGLTPNSIVLSTAVTGQSYYIALWQNKSFVVILAILNVDEAASKKAAVAENSRIK